MKKILPLTIILWFIIVVNSFAEDGYNLWLRYVPVENAQKQSEYRQLVSAVVLSEMGDVTSVIKNELKLGFKGLLGINPRFVNGVGNEAVLIIGTPETNKLFQASGFKQKAMGLGDEGYIIESAKMNNQKCLVILANKPAGALYGTFSLLRLMQTGSSLENLNITEIPKIKHRLLNHWDNLDRTVERGYAGFSVWDWHKLPDYIDPRYIDYARANASIGINGTVLTNVNANSYILTPQYIAKVAALANVFRPYGIKVYLTARFSSPIEIGGLKTADPLDAEVRNWWKEKVGEIYKSIPDFGGFLVKANSEGQPGPQKYGRTHADGANMLAGALAPHGGIVMWRAFVYSNETPVDRAKQANNEFEPLDGKFLDNVLIQVKNGPIDFQPREPFHPLFGAMPNTSLALELQITQEYLGQGTHLVYLAPLYRECLESDTYAKGKGTTVAKIIDGTAYNRKETAIAGVSNIGTDRNWTGHQFGQANWYAFGRLAWNSDLTSKEIAEEWIRMTFGNDPELISTIEEIMLPSRENAVNYMTPLGLHHIMAWGNHYGPGPWVDKGRADWTAVYYHKADTLGIGFDRTGTGSNAVEQYKPEVGQMFANLETCPDKFLLWFHHLPWDYKMKSGNTLWDEMCYKYNSGVDSVRKMARLWSTLENKVDKQRFEQVKTFLKIQEKEAEWWRNACLLYFRQFSRMPFPKDIEQPSGTLKYYESLKFPYAPGIKPSW